MKQRHTRLLAACLLGIASAALYAQNVTKENVPGVVNFARVDMTIACAGATKASAASDLRKMGYASVINLRQASEPGADVEAEAAEVKSAQMNYIHLPFNAASPDPELVNNFLKAVTDKKNQPAFVHCASGNRAAALWMIKRMQVDKWDADRASAEAAALGLANPALKTFALNYVETHK